MKKISLIIATLFFAFSSFSQNSPVEKLFEKYANKDGFTTITISKYMFGLFAKKNTDNKDNFGKATNGLESLRILTVDDSILNTKINFYKEITREFPLDQYKELMSVKEKDQDMKMLINEKDGRIKEFLMIVGGKKSNVLIYIKGDIDLASLAEISKEMNVQGLDNLDKLESMPKKK